MTWVPISCGITGTFLLAANFNITGEPIRWSDALLAALMGATAPLVVGMRAYADSGIAAQYPAVPPGQKQAIVELAADRLDALGRNQGIWTTAFLASHSIILPFVWWIAQDLDQEADLDSRLLLRGLIGVSFLVLAAIGAAGIASQSGAAFSARHARAYVAATMRRTGLGDFLLRVYPNRAIPVSATIWILFQGYIAMLWALLGVSGLATVFVDQFTGSR